MSSDAPGWGARWREVLTSGPPAVARDVQRGQALARRGAVTDLVIEPGRIAGRVRDDRLTDVRAECVWPVPDDAVWAAAVEALASEVRFTAALLDGQLPIEALELFATVGVPLIPTTEQLTMRCSCAPTLTPCRHLAAVHVAAALRLDRTPTLLLVLRGRSREDLLHAVRAERGGGLARPLLEQVDVSAGLEAARADLDAIELHPAPVVDPAALLEHLGEPPGVEDLTPLVDAVERAAATAWRLAAGDGAEAAEEEVLLAELRAQRVASVASLAAALGHAPDEVAARLDALFTTGAVLRTGSGERTRYRASS